MDWTNWFFVEPLSWKRQGRVKLCIYYLTTILTLKYVIERTFCYLHSYGHLAWYWYRRGWAITHQTFSFSSRRLQSVKGGSLDVFSCSSHNPALNTSPSLLSRYGSINSCMVLAIYSCWKKLIHTVCRLSIICSTGRDSREGCMFMSILISSVLLTICCRSSRTSALSRSWVAFDSRWPRAISIFILNYVIAKMCLVALLGSICGEHTLNFMLAASISRCRLSIPSLISRWERKLLSWLMAPHSLILRLIRNKILMQCHSLKQSNTARVEQIYWLFDFVRNFLGFLTF